MFLKALEVQRRVVIALFLREMKTRFGEKRLGFLWAFIEPIIHVAVFIGIWEVFGRMGPRGVDTILFLITGIIPYLMFNKTIKMVSNSIAGNRALMVFPQIKGIDFIISRMMMEFTTYSLVFIVMLLGCSYFGIVFTIRDPLGLMLDFIYTVTLAGGIGFLLVPIISILPIVESLMSFFNRVMYVTSGVFFSMDKIPFAVREYVVWNPLFQLTHIIKADFFPNLPFPEQYWRTEYMIFLTAGCWLFGFILYKRLFKYIIEK